MFSRQIVVRRQTFPWSRKLNATKTGSQETRKINNSWRDTFTPKLVVGAVATGYVVSSIYVRHWRSKELESLEPMRQLPPGRQDLLELMERTGLMGKSGAKSVKDELDDIRKWHVNHGYNGGVVLRELTKPTFMESSDIVAGLEEFALDPTQLARRECYYLYYEITGTGEIKQQIFCRGTTLLIDAMTCFLFWMVHDEELGCRIHLGFRNQADRILEDIEPLLAPASDKRTTVEVSGHSLGGAVGFIVAAKLRKRGYRVIKATAVASPRFCASKSSSQALELLLPKDNIRIENDLDIVPFLPPLYHSGNKIYVVNNSRKVYYVPSSNTTLAWLDSIFLNCRVLEIIAAKGIPHRMPYYISHVRSALKSHDSLPPK